MEITFLLGAGSTREALLLFALRAASRLIGGWQHREIGLNISSVTFHDPSDCLRQIVTYLPLSVISPKVAVYVPVE